MERVVFPTRVFSPPHHTPREDIHGHPGLGVRFCDRHSSPAAQGIVVPLRSCGQGYRPSVCEGSPRAASGARGQPHHPPPFKACSIFQI